MKITVTSMLLLLCTFIFPAHAVTTVAVPGKAVNTSDSALQYIISKLTPRVVEEASGRKMGWLQKLQLKIIQKKLKKQGLSAEDITTRSTKTLSVISLVSGALGLALLFAGWGLGVLIFTLAAIITGIIALSNNNSRKHRTMAILGIVLGTLTVVITLIAALVLIAFWGWS